MSHMVEEKRNQTKKLQVSMTFIFDVYESSLLSSDSEHKC
jgi:hypothetical protein